MAQRDQDFTADDPASAPGLVDSVNTVASEGEDLFIELRLDTPQDKPIRAQLGVSYLNQEQVQDGFQESFVDLPDAFETAPPAFGGAGLPMPLGVIDVGGIFAFDQEVESIAGYVDLEADITEDLTAGFAVRHTSDDKSGVQRQGLEGNPILVGLFASALPTLETALEETFNETSFSGDLNYNLNDTSSVYFRAATGFRAGGLNEIASSPDLLAYDPETTISYELGFKSFAAGGALGFNASIYHQTLDDALLFVGDPGNPAAGIAVNAGETRAIGVEAEVSWRPSDFVTVFASGSYVDAEITEISATAASLGGVVGNRPTRAPKWTAAAALIAEKPISDDVTALFSTNLSYLSDSFDDVANTENLGELFTLDLTAGFEYKNYSLVGFVDNLTEDRNFQQISNISNPTIGTLFRQSEPRTYGVRLVADF